MSDYEYGDDFLRGCVCGSGDAPSILCPVHCPEIDALIDETEELMVRHPIAIALGRTLDSRPLIAAGLDVLRDATSRSWTRRQLNELQSVRMVEWYSQDQDSIDDDDLARIYSSEDYLSLSVHCYLAVSVATCRMASGWIEEVGGADTMIDTWAGCGMTTAHLALSLPQTQLAYHNVRGLQWDFAEELMLRRLRLPNVVMTEEPIPTDAVFTAEAMEHFRDPVGEIARFYHERTRILLDCSSFAYDGVGHWNRYATDRGWVDRKKFRKIYNEALRAEGWRDGHRVFGTKPFWMGRPQPWVRKVKP